MEKVLIDRLEDDADWITYLINLAEKKTVEQKAIDFVRRK